jgi:hypothetical protein
LTGKKEKAATPATAVSASPAKPDTASADKPASAALKPEDVKDAEKDEREEEKLEVDADEEKAEKKVSSSPSSPPKSPSSQKLKRRPPLQKRRWKIPQQLLLKRKQEALPQRAPLLWKRKRVRVYACRDCDEEFTDKQALIQHEKSHQE